MAEEPLPLLKLVIEEGPRWGETLEFLSTQPPIRIGRVVRGNSLPIKDPGISTKHLTIEFKSNKWLITDNDSLNGTILNHSKLPPLSPTALGDGDIVKIGEVTVISVRLLKLGILEAELGFGGGLGKKARGRPKKEKAEILTENVGPVSTRRTRSSKNEINSLNVVEEIKNGEDTELGFEVELGKKVRGRPNIEKVRTLPENAGPTSTRRTRSSKNEVSNLSVVEETNEDLGVAAEVLEKMIQRGRGGRGKEKAIEAVDLGKKNHELGPIKVEQISTRRTRSCKVNENVEREHIAALVNGIKVSEKGHKWNTNDNENLNPIDENCSGNGNLINVQSGNGLNSEKVVVKTEPRESFCEEERVFGTDKREGERERDCTEESGFKSGKSLDWEKMTLGDWFAYLDVYLPKTIYEETEKIIMGMHHKAEKFREFVQEHEKK